MSKTELTALMGSLNEVSTEIENYIKNGTDKDALKSYLYDVSADLYETVSSITDYDSLEAISKRLEELTDELDPKTLMVIGFYNRFGKIIDDVDAKMKEINSSIDINERFAAKTTA
jgi:predicted butyrate kinase (DUF1464 family)